MIQAELFQWQMLAQTQINHNSLSHMQNIRHLMENTRYLESMHFFAVFANQRIIDGMETLGKLENLPVGEKYRPTKEVTITGITIHANPLADDDESDFN